MTVGSNKDIVTIYKYRFYAIAITGFIIMVLNIDNAKSDFKLILWAIGYIIAITGVSGQLIIAPNFEKDE